MAPSEANNIWSKALTKKDERVAEIIDMIIKANGEGIPCILNRNPKNSGDYIVRIHLGDYIMKSIELLGEP